MNMRVQVSFLRKVLSRYMPKSAPYYSLQWLYQLTFPPTVQEGSFFSIPPPAFVDGGLINDGHSDWCEVLSHGSFDLHFSNNQGW